MPALRLPPDQEALQQFRENHPEIKSIQQIVSISEDEFVKRYAQDYFNCDLQLTRRAHKIAAEIQEKAALIWANMKDAASPYLQQTLFNNIPSEFLEHLKSIPDYQRLFGSLDYLDCDHARSIFSPAAYLVDLLRFVDTNITTHSDNKISRELQLHNRRPDLAKIELDKANTEGIISYIDLIIEVLESLMRTKENPDAYRVLHEAGYPFDLPFNLPLVEIRSYLARMKIDLAEIYAAFEKDVPILEGHLKTLRQEREILALSPEEYDLLSTENTNEEALRARYSKALRVYVDDMATSDTLQKVATALQEFNHITRVESKDDGYDLLLREYNDQATGKRFIVTEGSDPTEISPRVSITDNVAVNHAVKQVEHWAKWFNGANDLANVRVFLERTGLTRAELNELIYQDLDRHEFNAGLPRLFFINNVDDGLGHLEIEQDPDQLLDPSYETETLLNLSPLKLDRIYRFVKLARKVGWSFSDLDWVLRSFAETYNPETVLKFDGINDYVACTGINKTLVEKKFTIEAWVNPAQHRINPILAKGEAGDQKHHSIHFIFWVDEEGKLALYDKARFTDDDNLLIKAKKEDDDLFRKEGKQGDALVDAKKDLAYLRSQQALPAGVFSHVAVTIDGDINAFRVYVDVMATSDTMKKVATALKEFNHITRVESTDDDYDLLLSEYNDQATGKRFIVVNPKNKVKFYINGKESPVTEGSDPTEISPRVAITDPHAVNHVVNHVVKQFEHWAKRFAPEVVGTDLEIGRELNACCFYGLIKEVRLWNAVRPSADIARDRYRRLTGREQKLTGYWPLVETFSGQLLDYTTNANHGALGGDVLVNQPKWEQHDLVLDPLPVVQGFQFNGIDQFLAAREVKGFDALKHLTIEAWVLLHETRENIIVAKGSEGNGQLQFLLGIDADNKVYFHSSGLSGIDLKSDGVVEPGALRHVAVTFSGKADGKAVSFFIDGELSGTRQVKEPTLTPRGTSLFVGRDLGSRYFSGLISGLRIWNKSDFSERIRDILNRPLTAEERGDLLGYWPLDAMSTEPRQGLPRVVAADLSSSHNDLYLGGYLEDYLPTRTDILSLPNATPVQSTGTVLVFDGANDVITIRNEGNGGLGRLDRMTLGFWFKADDTRYKEPDDKEPDDKEPDGSARRQVLYLQGDAEAGLNVYLEDGILRVLAWCAEYGPANVQETVLQRDAVSSGEWHYFAVVNDESVARGYVEFRAWLDGNALALENSSYKNTPLDDHQKGFSLSPVGTACLGGLDEIDGEIRFEFEGDYVNKADERHQHYFAGQIADVRLWNEAKTSEEIKAARYAPSDEDEALVFSLPLDDGNASISAQSSSNLLCLPGGYTAKRPLRNVTFLTHGEGRELENVYSHYAPYAPTRKLAEVLGWQDYVYTGRFLVTDSDAGIGVTFFSQYPNEQDRFYCLRRYKQQPTFHLSAHPFGVNTISGDNTDPGMQPEANTWYRFRVEVQNESGQERTRIRAKLWKDGKEMPAAYAIEAFDGGANRITAGTVGVWCFGPGEKRFDDLQIQELATAGQEGAVRLLNISFESYQTSGSPYGWVDTSARVFHDRDADLFATRTIKTNQVLHTESSAINVHAHYAPASGTVDVSTWSAYVYSGRLRFEDNDSELGITFFSQYPNSDTYYRLRRLKDRKKFYLTSHGAKISVGEEATINLDPKPRTWYRFRVQVYHDPNHSKSTGKGVTVIRASLWEDGKPEPIDYEISAHDFSDPIRHGTVGVWTGRGGTKYFDDLKVLRFDPAQLATNQPATALQGQIIYASDFENDAEGQLPPDWLPTAAKNSMTPAPKLFDVFAFGNNVLAPIDKPKHEESMHCHYAPASREALNWRDYVYTGKMYVADAGSSVGVTFYSRYPDGEDRYYRLRRHKDRPAFHLAPHPHGLDVLSGEKANGEITTEPDTWYRFRIQVATVDPSTGSGSSYTRIRARVWNDGERMPAEDQIVATDASDIHIASGTVGIWAGDSDLAKFDELQVSHQVYLDEDFAQYSAGEKPAGWQDGGSAEAAANTLFQALEADGQRYYGTRSKAATGVYSIFENPNIQRTKLSNYSFSGRMRQTNTAGSIGVLFFSRYPEEGAYHMLGRTGKDATFRLSSHPAKSRQFSKVDPDSDLQPEANVWYRFHIEVSHNPKDNPKGFREGTTRIFAKIWRDGETEPAEFKMTALDYSNPITSGLVAVWGAGPGEKHFDDLVVNIPGVLLKENFDGVALGEKPAGWIDTSSRGRYEMDEALFESVEFPDDNVPNWQMVNDYPILNNRWALHFNGDQQYLAAGDVLPINELKAGFTIEAWLRPDAHQDNPILSHGDSLLRKAEAWFGLNSDGRPVLNLVSTGRAVVWQTDALPTDKFSHVAFSVSTKAIRFTNTGFGISAVTGPAGTLESSVTNLVTELTQNDYILLAGFTNAENNGLFQVTGVPAEAGPWTAAIRRVDGATIIVEAAAATVNLDKNPIECFVDGVSVPLAGNSGGQNLPTAESLLSGAVGADLEIGRDMGELHFHGYIQEVRFWKKALNEAQIKAGRYLSPRRLVERHAHELFAYWPFPKSDWPLRFHNTGFGISAVTGPAGTLESSVTNLVTELTQNDYILLAGFTNAKNNGLFQVTGVPAGAGPWTAAITRVDGATIIVEAAAATVSLDKNPNVHPMRLESDCPFPEGVAFTAGGTDTPADGDTLTEGSVTALIKRVILQSGTWAGGTAAGRLIVDTPTGGNFSAGAATAGSVAVTLNGAESDGANVHPMRLGGLEKARKPISYERPLHLEDGFWAANRSVLTFSSSADLIRHPSENGNPPNVDRKTLNVERRTVEVWFKAEDIYRSERKQVIYHEGEATKGLLIYIDAGRLYFGGYDGKTWQGSWLVTDRITSGQWHHAALVLDGRDELRRHALQAFLDGKVVGVATGILLADYHFAFNLGGTEWPARYHDSEVEVAFTAGGTGTPVDGDTLTEGSVTARIKRVILQSGTWAGGTAAGRMIVDTPAGGNFSVGAATADSVAVTLTGSGHRNYFQGQLLGLRIWDTARTFAEIHDNREALEKGDGALEVGSESPALWWYSENKFGGVVGLERLKKLGWPAIQQLPELTLNSKSLGLLAAAKTLMDRHRLTADRLVTIWGPIKHVGREDKRTLFDSAFNDIQTTDERWSPYQPAMHWNAIGADNLTQDRAMRTRLMGALRVSNEGLNQLVAVLSARGSSTGSGPGVSEVVLNGDYLQCLYRLTQTARALGLDVQGLRRLLILEDLAEISSVHDFYALSERVMWMKETGIDVYELDFLSKDVHSAQIPFPFDKAGVRDLADKLASQAQDYLASPEAFVSNEISQAESAEIIKFFKSKNNQHIPILSENGAVKATFLKGKSLDDLKAEQEWKKTLDRLGNEHDWLEACTGALGQTLQWLAKVQNALLQAGIAAVKVDRILPKLQHHHIISASGQVQQAPLSNDDLARVFKAKDGLPTPGILDSATLSKIRAALEERRTIQDSIIAKLETEDLLNANGVVAIAGPKAIDDKALGVLFAPDAQPGSKLGPAVLTGIRAVLELRLSIQDQIGSMLLKLRDGLDSAVRVELAELLGMDSDRTQAVIDHLADTMPPHRFVSRMLSVANDGAIPAELFATPNNGSDPGYFYRLSKILYLVDQFEMEAVEIRALLDAPEFFELAGASAILKPTIQDLDKLQAYRELRDGLESGAEGLLTFLKAPSENSIAAISALTGWDAQQIGALIDFNSGTGADFSGLTGLHHLKSCFDLSQAMGADIGFLIGLADSSDLSYEFYRRQSDGLLNVLRSNYSEDQWPKVYKPIRDKLAVQKRDALLGVVMQQIPRDIPGRRDPDLLYEYLLIDVQTGSEVDASRIQQAIASVQLYVQRCMMNLEKGVLPESVPTKQWEWMKNYRVWEANRKVFLYPENYIEPELRDTKTPLFEELEQELMQNDIDQAAVERVYVNYLDRFREVATLKIVGSYLHRETPKDETPKDETRKNETLYLIGRTNTEPRVFYHRELINNGHGEQWLPWRKIDLSINAEFVTPVYAFGKLFLFWPEFTKLKKSVPRQLSSTVRKEYDVYLLNEVFTERGSQKRHNQLEEQEGRRAWLLGQIQIANALGGFIGNFAGTELYQDEINSLNTDISKQIKHLNWLQAARWALEAELTPADMRKLEGTSDVDRKWNIDPDGYLFNLATTEWVEEAIDFYKPSIKYSYVNFTKTWIQPQLYTTLENALEEGFYRQPQWQRLYAQQVQKLSSQGAPQTETNVLVLQVNDKTKIEADIPDFDMKRLTWSFWTRFETQLLGGELGWNFSHATEWEEVKKLLENPPKTEEELAPVLKKIGQILANVQPEEIEEITHQSLEKSVTLFEYADRLRVTASNAMTAIATRQEKESAAIDTSRKTREALSKAEEALTQANRKNFAEAESAAKAAETVANAAKELADLGGYHDAAQLSKLAAEAETAAKAAKEAAQSAQAAQKAVATAKDSEKAKMQDAADSAASSAKTQAETAKTKIKAANDAAQMARVIEQLTPKWESKHIRLSVECGQPQETLTINLDYHTWQHLALSMAKNDKGYKATLYHYKAGDVDTTTKPGLFTTDALPRNGQLVIGQQAAGVGDDFSSQMSEFRLWDSVRDKDTIVKERSQRQTGQEPGLFLGALSAKLPNSMMELVTVTDLIFTLPPVKLEGERIILIYGNKGTVNDPQDIVKSIRNNLEDQNFDLTFQDSGGGRMYDVKLSRENGSPINSPTAMLHLAKTLKLSFRDFATGDQKLVVRAPVNSPSEDDDKNDYLVKNLKEVESTFMDVNNQPGWYIMDTGDEQFLVKALLDEPAQTTRERMEVNYGNPSPDDSSAQALSLSFVPVTNDPLAADMSEPTFKFERLSTFAVHDLSLNLFKGGIDSLLSLESQQTKESNFWKLYRPNSALVPPLENQLSETIDFRGAYRLYYEEIFFHIPFLIANQLNANQQFADAQKWYHYIFDPTARDDGGSDKDRYWKYLPFRTFSPLEPLKDLLADKDALAAYRDDPFDPHAIAHLRIFAYQKAVVMKYIDNLLDWGDALFAQDTRESINEAISLYVMAYNLLGPRPKAKVRKAFAAVGTYEDIKKNYTSNDLPNDLRKDLPDFITPETSTNGGRGTVTPSHLITTDFCVVENDRFLGFWDRVEERLFKIRHSQNIEGIFRQLALFEPPIEPSALVRAVAGGRDIGGALADLSVPVPHYRYAFMLNTAKDMVSAVIDLGSALQSALESRDDAALAALERKQGKVILEMTTAIKVNALDEARTAIDSLKVNKGSITAKHAFLTRLADQNLSPEERAALILLGVGKGIAALSTGLKLASSIAYAVPDVTVGGAGISSPLAVTTFGGGNVAEGLSAAADVSNLLAEIVTSAGEITEKVAVYARRLEQWEHERNIAARELDEIQIQIDMAELRKAMAERELNIHTKTIEHWQQVDTFHRSKFTSQALYNWMVGRLSGLYFQSYKLAYDLAKSAEKALQYELPTTESYISFGHWDGLKKGLLAGESLMLELNRMEKSHLAQDSRFQEIERTISMKKELLVSFLQLMAGGECEFQLSEALFDRDYPGHYFRVIKSLAISIIPAASAEVDQNQSVRATLVQMGSKALLAPDPNAVRYLMGFEDGEQPDGNTLRVNWRANQQIAISKWKQDNGMFGQFDLNFLFDDRYFPFEGTGAVSSWRLEMPQASNPEIKFDKIDDIVIHLRYTSKYDTGTFKDDVLEILDDLESNQ